MYFTHFFTSLTKKSNTPILIYLILNVFLIAWIFYAFRSADGITQPNFWLCMLSAIAIYAISILIALSPIGEWILRVQNGCKEIKRKEQIARIEPIFNEVYAKAKEMHPDLPDDITLYIKATEKSKDGKNEGEGPNAFAAGRKTICITKELLDQPDEQIKAILGHEFGHLAHHDTDIILVITVGNMIISGIISVVMAISAITRFVFALFSGSKDGAPGLVGLIMTSIFIFIVNIANRIWAQIGVWLCMKSCRSNEYLADEFSFNLGYGVPLCQFLDEHAGDCHAEGLFAALASSHPDTDDRIARLQELGCKYTK